MFRHICTLGLLLLVAAQSYAQPLPECYHTRQELYDYIFALQDSFPTLLKVDSIGHSRGDQLGEQFPIYAVKISDNVQAFEEEPVSLIIGHIHAEEVAGMEATINYMRLLLNNQEPYRTIRNQTQVYIIPTMNPDGLEVISLGWDNTWRKNGYVPPELLADSCIIVVGEGEDSCGVDLNRNFGLNWIYGDTLWVRGSDQPFDYFRGPGVFSEPEARAVRDFAMEIKPTVSIVWHSSRTGNVAERCIVAWQWGPDGAAKYSPDSAAIARVMHDYALKTRKYPPEGATTYLEVWGGTRNGDLQDWFYRDLGTIQILTETSPPEQIQPPCDPNEEVNLPELIGTLLPPMEWLTRRVINYPVSGDMDAQGAPLNIKTRDAATGDPISAEFRITNTWSPLLNPWYTHPTHGRATFLPPPGTVTVLARKEGYRSDSMTVTLNPGGSAVTANLNLTPLPWHTMFINVRNESGELIPARIHVDNGFPQTYDVTSGTVTLSKPETVVRLQVEPLQEQNVIARWYHFWHDRDTTINLVLPTASTIFSEDFEGGMGNWITGGTGGDWRVDIDTTSLQYGMTIHTNAEGYREQYDPNWDATFTYNSTISLATGNAFHLKFDRRGRLDMPADSFNVEVSANGGADWQQVSGYSDLEIPWTRTYADLSYWAGNTIMLRFRMKTDATLGDLGIHFDNVEVVGGLDTSAPQQPLPFPDEFKLSKVYPNPFNPTTTIAYEAASSGQIQFTIHNLLGQEVWSTSEAVPGPGHYELRWNGVNQAGQSVPSGIYFMRMATYRGVHGTQKLMLLK
ncbi:MAG: T9SS type A sorting domain-containing protein [Calditrichaeota bacterium]|nr:T9SS type A sorting domain-containing protein [Calditrichota bacterium]MCB9391425.1 T9SS type A sorting domain-containing protein [Calditrichota bacterium]